MLVLVLVVLVLVVAVLVLMLVLVLVPAPARCAACEVGVSAPSDWGMGVVRTKRSGDGSGSHQVIGGWEWFAPSDRGSGSHQVFAGGGVVRTKRSGERLHQASRRPTFAIRCRFPGRFFWVGRRTGRATLVGGGHTPGKTKLAGTCNSMSHTRAHTSTHPRRPS